MAEKKIDYRKRPAPGSTPVQSGWPVPPAQHAPAAASGWPAPPVAPAPPAQPGWPGQAAQPAPPVTAPRPVPTEVGVVGAAPPSWTTFWVFGSVVGVLLLLALIFVATGSAVGVFFFGFVGGILGLLYLLSLWGARSVIGKPQVTAGAAGIWAPRFQLRWDQVRALDFVSNGREYSKIDPHKTSVAKRQMTSLVVTSRERGANGRPVQYGTTLCFNHSHNYEEFRQAVRRLAPHVEFRTDVSVEDTVLDPAVQQAVQQQLASTGRLVVTTKRGKEKMSFDRNGATLGRNFAPWPEITAAVAVIDLHTDRTGGISTTTRTQTLVLLTNQTNPNGQERRFRHSYDESFQPPIEYLLPVLRQLAPHIQVADQR